MVGGLVEWILISLGFDGVLGPGKPKTEPAAWLPTLHNVYGTMRILILQIALLQIPKFPLLIALSISFPETYDERVFQGSDYQSKQHYISFVGICPPVCMKN